MIRGAAVSLSLFFSLAPLALARQPAATESPSLEPELFEARLEPQYLAAQHTGDTGDAWDDYDDRWRFRFTLAPWMAGIEGTVGKGDFESDLDVSFGDLFDKFTIGAGLNLEAGKGPFSALVFALYQQFDTDLQTRRGFDGDGTLDIALVDMAGAYRLLNTPVGDADARFSVEALAGVRWTYLGTEIEINEGLLAGRSEDREKNWFDPYVGARLRYDFDRHWTISGLATIGGFGVGSDLAWSAYGQLEYRFNETWSAIVGYRAIDYDYDDGGFTFDVTMHGPVIGVAIRM